ncbi:hypothetical protein [Sedimentitalea sp.]
MQSESAIAARIGKSMPNHCSALRVIRNGQAIAIDESLPVQGRGTE